MNEIDNYKTDFSIIGEKIGMLTVLECVGKTPDLNETLWRVRCDCGNEKIVRRGALIQGKRFGRNMSCGCARRLRDDYHGYSKERIYKIYNGIKSRCYNPHSESYEGYGGRGIKMCQEWLDSFLAFKDWSFANGYSEELTIDRIDTNGDYSPENCRWADDLTQANNKRNNRPISVNGITFNMGEWARELDQIWSTFQYRIIHNDHIDLIKYAIDNNLGFPIVVTDHGETFSYTKEESNKIVNRNRICEIGQRYGRLTIIEDLGMMTPEGQKKRKHMLRCKCDCGKIKVVSLAQLRNGHTKSCGCYRKETAPLNNKFYDCNDEKPEL